MTKRWFAVEGSETRKVRVLIKVCCETPEEAIAMAKSGKEFDCDDMREIGTSKRIVDESTLEEKDYSGYMHSSQGAIIRIGESK